MAEIMCNTEKVIFFHQCNDFTGSTRVLANIIESEYAQQYVTVITINNQDGFLSTLSNARIVPIYYLLYRNKRIPLITPMIWKMHALILALTYGIFYNVFYINTITPYYAAIVGFLYRKRIVYHVHEKFVKMDFNAKIAEYIFNHVSSERIFVSNYVKNQYMAKRGCRTIVKYNTLSKSFLAKVNIILPEKREKKSVLLITSLAKHKGIFTYIEIAKRMPEYLFRLLVSADKRSIVTYLNCTLPNNIEIIPTQTDIHPFLRKTDLILNLSIPKLSIETFGMTILEAMAYGIPAIVPNIGGPVELVINGYNGYCVDVTDVEKVVATIKTVFEEQYIQLSRNSLARVKLFI